MINLSVNTANGVLICGAFFDGNKIYPGIDLGSDYHGNLRGIYSLDNGTGSWTSKMTGIDANTDFLLSVAMATNDINTDFGFVQRTSDGGTTWQQAYVNTADQHPAGVTTIAGGRYHSIGLENTSAWQMMWSDAQHLFAGFSDIKGVRSSDRGTTWTLGYTGNNANTLYRIARHPTTGALYAGTSEYSAGGVGRPMDLVDSIARSTAVYIGRGSTPSIASPRSRLRLDLPATLASPRRPTAFGIRRTFAPSRRRSRSSRTICSVNPSASSSTPMTRMKSGSRVLAMGSWLEISRPRPRPRSRRSPARARMDSSASRCHFR